MSQLTTILIVPLALLIIGLAAFMGLAINERIADKTALQDNAAASGTITISDVINDGDLVNITSAAGVLTTFEFDTNSNVGAGHVAVSFIEGDAFSAAEALNISINSELDYLSGALQ